MCKINATKKSHTFQWKSQMWERSSSKILAQQSKVNASDSWIWWPLFHKSPLFGLEGLSVSSQSVITFAHAIKLAKAQDETRQFRYKPGW